MLRKPPNGCLSFLQKMHKDNLGTFRFYYCRLWTNIPHLLVFSLLNFNIISSSALHKPWKISKGLLKHRVHSLTYGLSEKIDTLVQVFSCHFKKFLRTAFFQNTSGRLLHSLIHFFESIFKNYRINIKIILFGILNCDHYMQLPLSFLLILVILFSYNVRPYIYGWKLKIYAICQPL